VRRRLLQLLSLGTVSLSLGTVSLAALSLGTLSLATACTPTPAASVTTELQIGGMVCASCSEAITFALTKLPGIESVAVDHSSGHAVIRHDPARTSRDAIVATITGLGYTVAP
jgi:Cu+-exporting ATPase